MTALLFPKRLRPLLCLLMIWLPFSSCVMPARYNAADQAPPGAVVYRRQVLRVEMPRRARATRRPNEFDAFLAKNKLSKNLTYKHTAQRVGLRLASVIPMPNARWEFLVFDNPTPNAFATPGGKVGINSGLFSIVQNDAQLAAVLGHEISHVTANHAEERENAIQYESYRAAVAASQSAPDLKTAQRNAKLFAYAATINYILPFTRYQELQADELGTIYMARAGYDPGQAVVLWKNFAAVRARDGSGDGPEFLSSHPLDAQRIAVLERLMPRAYAEYRRATRPARRFGFF